VRKSQFPWIVVIIVVVATAAWHLVGFILAGLFLLVSYIISLRLHPRMRHGRCKGTGELRGSVFTWTHRRCPSPNCQAGRTVRVGNRLLGSDYIKGQRADGIASKKAALQQHQHR